MKNGFLLIYALALLGCPAPEPPPPQPVVPSSTTDVMTMLGVQSMEELQSNFREEERRDDQGRLTEKRWYDATDALRLRKVYVYDDEGYESEHVFYDGNGERLYTFRMQYDNQRNRIGESLYNNKDELISQFTYDIPVPPQGAIEAPPPSQVLDPTIQTTARRPSSASQEPQAVNVPQSSQAVIK